MTDVASWDTQRVLEWLSVHGHDNKEVPQPVQSACVQHGICGADLAGLTREDLRDLGYTKISNITTVENALKDLLVNSKTIKEMEGTFVERIKSTCPMLLPLLGSDLGAELDEFANLQDVASNEGEYWKRVHIMLILRVVVAQTRIEMASSLVVVHDKNNKGDERALLTDKLKLFLELLDCAQERLKYDDKDTTGWMPLLERMAPEYKLCNVEKLFLQLLVVRRIQPMDGPLGSLMNPVKSSSTQSGDVDGSLQSKQAWVCGMSPLQLKQLANEDRSICQERILVITEDDYSDESKLSVSVEVCKALMGQELGVEERLRLAGTKLLRILDGKEMGTGVRKPEKNSNKLAAKDSSTQAILQGLLQTLNVEDTSDGEPAPAQDESTKDDKETHRDDAGIMASSSTDSVELVGDMDVLTSEEDNSASLLADLTKSSPPPSQSPNPTEDRQPRCYTCELDYLNDQFALVMQQVQSSNQRLAQDLKDASVVDNQPRWMRTTDYGSSKVSVGELTAKLKLAQRKIDLSLELTRKKGIFYPRLEGLVDQLGLDSLEKSVLLYLAGSMISPIFKSCITSSFRSNGRRCAVGDLLVVFCPSVSEQVAARTYFYRTGKLVRKGLIRVYNTYGESDLTDQEVQLDRRVLDCIVGLDKESTEVVKGGNLYEPKVDLDQVVLPPNLKESILESVTYFDSFRMYRKRSKFDETISYGVGLTLMLCGPSGTGKTMTANAIAGKLGKKLLLVNFPNMWENDSRRNGDSGVQSIFREAELSDAIIFFDECDSLFAQRGTGGSQHITQLLTELERFEGIVFLATNRPFDLDEAMYRRISEVFDFKAPNHLERLAIWKLATAHDAIPCEESIDWEAIALQFEMTGGFIKNAVISALLAAVGRDPVSPMISQPDIIEGCKKQMRGALQMVDFDERLLPQSGLGDLVASDEVKGPLKEIVQLEKARGVLFGLWGFSDDMRSRQGTTCLFWGPRGTGKSRAAEAVGFELGKALKIVDIPHLLAKMSGRKDGSSTVRDVFKEARLMDGVLVLDGYSMDPSGGSGHGGRDDSRLLNLLVREMARFPGVVIMMVDTPGALDIFVSRLDKSLLSGLKFLVEFALPNLKTRQVLWEKLLPSEVPTAKGVNFQDLARMSEKFSQVQIGNAIYRAAAVAALRPEEERRVKMSDLKAAIDDEKHRGESAVDRWVKAQYV